MRTDGSVCITGGHSHAFDRYRIQLAGHRVNLFDTKTVKPEEHQEPDTVKKNFLCP